jgi:hypothetical protein
MVRYPLYITGANNTLLCCGKEDNLILVKEPGKRKYEKREVK